ncbi:MAG TPA: PQQ-binding-like beta-propeller repeat protein [Phycisphaerae bacterium]|nr:PQQ-binding-like beta-propeller repeat protein [Phycisphaerae bacterium]
MREPFQRLYPDRVAVLDPAFDKLEGTRWNLAVTYSGRTLEILEASTGRPAWPRSIACAAEPTLLGMSGTHYVFATRHRIFALEGTDGALAWQIGEEPRDDPNIDPESIPSWTDRFMTARYLYAVSTTGELVGIDLGNGAVRWRHKVDKRVSNVLLADNRCVYYVTRQDEKTAIHVLDAESGAGVRVIPMAGEEPIQALRAASRGSFLAVMGQRVAWVHTATGEVGWQTTMYHAFPLSALQTNETGLFMAWNSGAVTRLDFVERGSPADGLFESGLESNQIWTTLCPADFYVAGDSAIMAFETRVWPQTDRQAATSRPTFKPRWRVERVAAFTCWPPLLTADAILTISIEGRDTTTTATTQAASSQPETVARFRVRAFSRADGHEIRIAADGALVTEPLKSFSGIHVRDNCVVVLDGDRLIGYPGAD